MVLRMQLCLAVLAVGDCSRASPHLGCLTLTMGLPSKPGSRCPNVQCHSGNATQLPSSTMTFSHLLSSVLPWQVGGGGIKAHTHTRAPMTMGEVLEVMLAKARVEAEDAQVRFAVLFYRVPPFAREEFWEVVLVQVDKWRRRSTAQHSTAMFASNRRTGSHVGAVHIVPEVVLVVPD